ncbi:MAG TPA: TRAP transporter large permease subunit, partial [Spirochaetota bacterium]|nr:TRAP transporter large permease subunit [Spirochaetota bacterium]
MNYRSLLRNFFILLALFTLISLFAGFATAVVVTLLTMVFLGLPLYIVLFGVAVALLWDTKNFTLASVVIDFQKLESQDFIAAIPLFTFAGYLLSASKSPDRIIRLFKAFMSYIPGADAAIVIIIMAFFTALTGASGVSILALGGLMYPLLRKNNNTEKFSLGLITSSGSIGLLFAPALPVIIYAIIVSQNMTGSVDIQKLFTAALLPAFILVGAMILFASIKKKGKRGEKQKFSVREAVKAIVNARYEIPLPFIIYGGIYSGFFTVMDAALVVAVYVFLTEFFFYRDLKLKKDFIRNVAEAMKLAGGIFIIMACAFILTKYISLNHIPEIIITKLSPYITTRFSFLIFVNLFLLVTGCLLDIFSAIMIVLPILIPVVEQYGINPYHFAIIFLVNLEIGYLTPPVGMNLFIASYRFKKRITMLYRSALPFLLLMVVILILITYVPWLSVFTLPDQARAGSETGGSDFHAPARIENVKLLAVSSTNAVISFKAVGDDGRQGKISGYRIAIGPEP